MVPAFILIGTHNHFGGGDPYRYSIFFILCFAWIGIAQPRGTSLRIMPLFLPAYLVPLITSGHWSPVSASSVLYVAPLCVVISETLAWGAHRASAAEQLAMMRQDFVSAVSHELRTPLASVLGYAELLQARWESLDDQQRRTRIDYIVTAANRQLSLVEDLLHVSRLEATELRLDLVPVKVSAAVLHAADIVQGSYRGQIVNMEGAADLQALANLSRTEQVLTNLIDNAAKYSPEGAEVRVAWTREGNFAAMRIYDRGPGISKEGQQVLFTRFGRVPGSRTRAGRVGTGLGLHLGREYAQAMGGTLRLEATGPSGSVFKLSLPLYEEPSAMSL